MTFGFSAILRLMMVFAWLIAALPMQAQVRAPEAPPVPGGVQGLEQILERQKAQARSPREAGAGQPVIPAVPQLGTRGGQSDADLWRALRAGEGAAFESRAGPSELMQNGGMLWLSFRAGPLRFYGGWLLVGTLGALALFYLLRGRIRIRSGLSGIRIRRFNSLERFFHWLMGGAFIILGITGLATLFGRLLIPMLGHEMVSPVLIAGKWAHNNVSWAFMLGLAGAFLSWVAHNIPARHDLVWLMKGGGIFTNTHVPSRKFNAGQKLIFWGTMVMGAVISASGLSLLFPAELEMAGPLIAQLNELGVPGWIGLDPLPLPRAPQEEMQLVQILHGAVSFVMMAMILAHIYIGSVGMEGAIDAMTDGEVDINWAREHHDLWVKEVEAKQAAGE